MRKDGIREIKNKEDRLEMALSVTGMMDGYNNLSENKEEYYDISGFCASVLTGNTTDEELQDIAKEVSKRTMEVMFKGTLERMFETFSKKEEEVDTEETEETETEEEHNCDCSGCPISHLCPKSEIDNSEDEEVAEEDELDEDDIPEFIKMLAKAKGAEIRVVKVKR